MTPCQSYRDLPRKGKRNYYLQEQEAKQDNVMACILKSIKRNYTTPGIYTQSSMQPIDLQNKIGEYNGLIHNLMQNVIPLACLVDINKVDRLVIHQDYLY